MLLHNENYLGDVLFSQDFVLRQIENLARFVAKFLFDREDTLNEIIDENGDFSSDDFFRYQLKKLVYDGRINDAEDMLFERINTNKRPEYLKIALEFYETLAQLDERTLIASDFSMQEIIDGLNEIKKIYGINE